MIRTNLSTRPFYNDRAVRFWLVALAGLVAVATAFNVSRVLHYSRNDTELGLRASQDEAAVRDLRAAAARERASVDAAQITIASAEAREANDLIDRRTFSWTELFNRFEATLPPDVRITAVRPHLDDKDRHIELVVTVLARSIDDINQFMENLDTTHEFDHLNPNTTRITESGEAETVLSMKYMPPPGAKAKP